MLTFLRGDSRHVFPTDSKAADTYAVYLRGLQNYVTMPPELLGCLKLLPYVLVSGPHRTFLKEDSILEYIPGGRADRTKEAPNTIFVRALQIKKNQLSKEDCTVLDQGRHIKGLSSYIRYRVWPRQVE